MERVQVPGTETGPVNDAEATPTPAPNAIQPQVRNNQGNVQTSTDKPGWLPEKFKSPEELAKAYSELEKKLSSPKETNSETTENSENSQQQEAVVTPEETKAFQEWENKFSDYSKEYFEKGQLSKESYAKLTQMGYPKAIVDAYINGQIAISNQGTQQLMGEIGGEQGFKEMHDWATENLSQDEIDSYNALLETGDQRQANFAVKGMYARYKSSMGKQPKLISGTQSEGSTKTFRSVAEITKAMSDPRYKNDPAYRKDVERRLATSNVL